MGFFSTLFGRIKRKVLRGKSFSDRTEGMKVVDGVVTFVERKYGPRAKQEVKERQAQVMLDKLAREAERRGQAFPWKQHKREESQYGGDIHPGLRAFLDGQIHPTPYSSNVEFFKYDKENQQLIVGYNHGIKGRLDTYAYSEIDEALAKRFYETASPGGDKDEEEHRGVWNELRVRGTIFGYKKPYVLVSGMSTHGTKWDEKAKWREEHGSIPPSGKIPESWKRGEGPYSPDWLARGTGGPAGPGPDWY